MNIIEAEELYSFAVELLSAGGFKPTEAADTAKVLIWANARGFDSHGVLRIPRYVEMVEQGRINPKASIEGPQVDGAVAKLNANNISGATSMLAAMDHALPLAKKFGVGWCSVKNITHAGAIGYYAMQACEHGCIGIVMSASGPLMAYHGARVSSVSTNPIAIAVPNSKFPLLLDMSTSTVALGKILHARDSDQKIPVGWGIDGRGDATTDPNKVKSLTPLGGPKGSGLSLMIEVLSSVLISNPVISEVLSGGRAAMNGLAIALNIETFGDSQVFAQNITQLVSTIKELPTASGVDAVLMPGERGFRLAEERLTEGIPLASGTISRLFELADRLEVKTPEFK